MHVISPIGKQVINKLRVGDAAEITGVIYVARDMAHQRMIEALDAGNGLPFDISGQTIYYMGPSPAKPGQLIGSAGPTTSSRMDAYTPRLLSLGLRAMIGKGARSDEVKKAIVEYKTVYFVATGGAGALISKCIKKVDIVAYEDLGAEAILRIEVDQFPVVVANDVYGGDLYIEGKAKYQRPVEARV